MSEPMIFELGVTTRNGDIVHAKVEITDSEVSVSIKPEDPLVKLDDQTIRAVANFAIRRLSDPSATMEEVEETRQMSLKNKGSER